MKKLFNVALALVITSQTSVAFATGIAVQYEASKDFSLEPEVQELTFNQQDGLHVRLTNAEILLSKNEEGFVVEISPTDGSEQVTCKAESAIELENCVSKLPLSHDLFLLLKKLITHVPGEDGG